MIHDQRQATMTPEAWAAAQVEAVARDVETKEKRTKRPPTTARGVYFVWRHGGEAVGPKHVCADRECDKTRCALDGAMRGEFWVLWYDANSRRHREKAGTKAAAIDLYRRRKTETRQGKHFPESMRQRQDATLGAICDEYMAALKANRRDRRGQVKTRLAEVCQILGPRSAASVTMQDVERLKARLAQTPARGRKDQNDPEKERPRTPASVNRFIQDLRAAYNLARRNGTVEKNPVADVRLLRENNKRIREITADEEKAILAALDPATRRGGTDLRPLVRFLLETGLRLGEACALCWKDVDWPGGFLTLRETKAGERQHVPLNAEARAILEALGPRDGHIFAWPEGRPWTVDYVTHAFGKAVKDAGITDLHVHDTRHTFACRKLRAGVDLYTVSKLLRHASIAMTERYTHLTRGDLKAAAEKSTATSKAISAGGH